MPINIARGHSDEGIDRIIGALRIYEADHPGARIDLYRHDPASVRVRIINPEFAGRSKIDRSHEVGRYLDALSADDEADISTLILLAPEEAGTSLANIEFEDPVPSIL